MNQTQYKLTLSQLKNPGVKLLKSLIAGPKPYDYSKLTYCHFKNTADYYSFRSSLLFHNTLAEIFLGSDIQEDEEYDMGWKCLTYREEIVYGNFANIILSLRQDITNLEEEVHNLSRRLDNI